MKVGGDWNRLVVGWWVGVGGLVEKKLWAQAEAHELSTAQAASAENLPGRASPASLRPKAPAASVSARPF